MIPIAKSNSTTKPDPDLFNAGSDIVKAQQAKPKKYGKVGQPAASRAGVIQTEEDRQFVSTLLHEVLTEYRQPKVRSDQELQERLDSYFKRCADSGQLPTVEEMCMSTGYSDAMIWDMETGRRKGFSPETADIIKKAKAFLKTFDAKLVVTGKMNFLAYCFRAKNYYGMSDKQEYVLTPNNKSETEYSADDLRKIYGDGDSGTVETTFSDEPPSDF